MGNFNLRLYVLLSSVFFFTTSNAQLLAPAKGFNVFVKNNITLGPADIEGGFAAGGNFIFSPSSAPSPSNYAGQANAGGTGNAYGTVSGVNYASVIGGTISWGSSTDHFDFNIKSPFPLIKLGATSLNGGTYASSKISNGTKFIQLNGTTQNSNFTGSGIINFTTEFTTLGTTSSCLSAKSQTVTTPTGTNWNINLSSLANNTIHILNVSGATLSALTGFEVSGASSTKILVINVNASGTYTMPVINQNSLSQAPYILWNFYNATTLSISRLVGSLLAPSANVTKPTGANNIDGQVVALSYTQLSGETHINSFNSSLSCTSCTATGGTIAASQTKCSPANPNLFTSSASGSVSAGTLSYTWESSTDSSNWTTISGAAAVTYDAPSGLTTTTWYRRKTSSTSECNAYSNVIKVTVVPLPVVTVAASVNPICAGESTTLSFSPSTGSTVIGWFKSNNGTGTNLGTTSTLAVNPSSTSSYSIVVANSGGCRDTATLSVTVKTKPGAGNDLVSCTGTSQTLTGSSNTGDWSAKSGNPSAITVTNISNSGNASVSFAQNATLGDYYFIYTDNGCTDTLKITLYNCCPKYAQSIGHSIGNVTSVNNSLGAPDGSGSTFTGNQTYSRIVWDMGVVMPSGTQVCFKIKKTGSETNAAFKIWYGLDGTLDGSGNPPSGYTEVYSTTTFTSTSYTDVCVTLPAGNCRYVKITSENVTDFNVDAVSAYINCSAPCTTPPSITECEAQVNGTWSVLSTCTVNVQAGQSLTLSVNPNSFTNYTQTWSGPNSFAATGNDAFISNSVTSSHAGTYTITVTNGTCTSTKSIVVNVTSAPCPSAGTDGNTTVCENSAEITLANFITGEVTGGTWSRVTGTGGIFNASTGKFTPNNNAITSTFRYVVVNSSPCSNDTSIATVTVKNVGTPAIASGNQNTCINTSTQFCAVTETGTQYYEWIFGSGATPSTSKNRCENVQWSTAGTKTVKLYLISTDGCISDTISYTVNVGNCCDGKVTGLFFKNGTTSIPVPNNSTFNFSSISGLYYFETSNSGTIGSVKYTITGPTNSTNIENTSPYNHPSTSGGNWTGAEGSYTVNLKTYSGADATGSICHDTTIAFTLINTNCDCPNNIVLNPSFEYNNTTNTAPANGGTAGWSTNTTGVNGFKFYSGTGFDVCGSYNSFIEATNTSLATNANPAMAWQQISATPGNIYTLKIFGGTHEPSLNHSFLLSFYNASGVRLAKDSVQVDYDVDPTGGLQQYTLGGTAPANTSYLRIEGKAVGDYLKIDMACLNMTVGATVNLGNYIWYDVNNNGIQDAGEPALVGASVKLYDGSGTTQIGTTQTTGANGQYNFTNLTPGTYIVGVTPPAGFKSSAIDAGDPDTDSDNNDDNGIGSNTSASETRSAAIDLSAGSEPTNDGDGNNGNLTVDFGFTGVGSIGDLVWNDNNGNGIQDGAGAGETGVTGVIVTLTYTYNGVSFTVKDTTDATGLYLFTNLPADGTTSYSIVFSNIPNGLNLTTSNAAGSNDNNDSDGLTPPSLTLPAATPNNTSVDLGLNAKVNLGDKVWFDQNNNGIQDPAEPGLAGASVQLYTGAGVAVGAPVTTTSTGLYNFNNLTPGDYIVGVTPPAGFTSSTINGGDPDTDTDNNDDNGSVVNGAEIRSLAITLTSGGEPTTDGDGNNGNLTVDFGFIGTGSIGDLVWNDNDGDGIQDGAGAGETGVAGVIATLIYTYNGVSYTVKDTTDATGLYLFTNLPANGTTIYTIVFSNVPGGKSVTTTDAPGSTDANDSDGLTPTSLTLPTATPNNLTIDLGLTTFVNLGNYVWYDIDNNGIQDPGEPAILNATVKLYNATGTIQIGSSITTGTNGEYNFTNLAPGTYVVGVTPPTGFKSSGNDAGDPDSDADNNDDNGIGTNTGEVKSLPITLVVGSEPTNDGDGNNGNLTVDFGFTGTGTIGDLVWSDKNGNGQQNMSTESGVQGVIVSINFTYNDAIILLYDTTDNNGNYLFQNLPPGSYTVEFENNTAMSVTMANQGTDDEGDSDGLTPPGVNLTAGQNILNIDLGLMETTAAIGNFVWNDLNADGDQDAGEPGIGGVSVTLTNVTTNATTPTTTGPDGRYLFSGLAPGTYKVTFGTPAGGYVPTTANVGTTSDALDSDAGVGGMTGNYTLVAGQVDTTVDAGFYVCPPPLSFPNSSICGNQRFNLNTLVPTLYSGGTWAITAPTSGTVANPSSVSAGTYVYTKVLGNDCIVTGTVTISKNGPDYIPEITLQKDTTRGIQPLNLVYKIFDNFNVQACSDVFILAPRLGNRYSFVYDPFLTTIEGPNGSFMNVTNEHWQYITTNTNFHVWKWVGDPANGLPSLFPAGHVSYLGITGQYDPLNTDGFTTFTIQVSQGSGGELITNNDTDSQTLIYFKN